MDELDMRLDSEGEEIYRTTLEALRGQLGRKTLEAISRDGRARSLREIVATVSTQRG